MARGFLVVLDSAGIGGAPDADAFFNDGLPDTGANTLGHIAQACAKGEADEQRFGALSVPRMASLGLGAAIEAASGLRVDMPAPSRGAWAAATEVSKGKDTPSGHWELAGLPVPWEWHYFTDPVASFPPGGGHPRHIGQLSCARHGHHRSAWGRAYDDGATDLLYFGRFRISDSRA